jgi:hypothetical protein
LILASITLSKAQDERANDAIKRNRRKENEKESYADCNRQKAFGAQDGLRPAGGAAFTQICADACICEGIDGTD